MVPGLTRGIDTPVVFTLEDLKKIYDRDAHDIKGMWAFHWKFHAGHMNCAIRANKCDWVMGILWNNFAEGMKWMVGNAPDEDDCIRNDDIKVLKDNSDVVMIFTGDYHPYKKHWDYLKSEIEREFPLEELKAKGILDEWRLYATLVYSIAIRILLHEIYEIKIDYHPSCGRDMWRHAGYVQWLKKRFGVEQELADAIRDEYGNTISGMRNRIPDRYNKRIKKALLLPEFDNIDDVNNHISDIKGLKAVSFFKEYGWLNVRFQFEDKYWWSEGLKLWT